MTQMDGGGEDAAALHWHAAGDPGQEHEAAWRFGLSGVRPGSPPGAAPAGPGSRERRRRG